MPRPPRPLQTALRMAGAFAFLAVAVGVSRAQRIRATARWVSACCRYEPAALVHGQVWRLVGSAFFLSHLRTVGLTTVMVVAFFVPYSVVAGMARSVVVFLAGHVLSTSAVAAVVLPAAAAHWHPAVSVKFHNDVGVSAGLSATAGALAVVAGRQHRGLGLAAAAAFLGWFLVSLLYKHPLVQVEHLLAGATGAGIEHRWPATPPLRARAPAR